MTQCAVGGGGHELLEEAAALRELVVPEYMSAHAVGRLLSAPLMSPPQLIRFDWSGRQGEDGEVLEEEQEAEVPLVLEGADEEVLAALAEHAPSLREVCLRCSGATSAAAMVRLLQACGARLRVLSLLGLDSLATPAPRARAAEEGDDAAASSQGASGQGDSDCGEVGRRGRERKKTKVGGGVAFMSQLPWGQLRGLQVLTLAQSGLTDEMLIGINAALGAHVRHLDVSLCVNITDAGLSPVLQKQEHLKVLMCVCHM